MTTRGTGPGFPRLFSPLRIGNVTLKNRIVSTGHETAMADSGGIGEAMLAYHEARARGGAGLIVAEVALVDDAAVFVSHPIKVRTTASRATGAWPRWSSATIAACSANCSTPGARSSTLSTAARRFPSRPRRCPTSASTSCPSRCPGTISRAWWRASATAPGACARPGSTAPRCWPATATCCPSSSIPGSICATTNTAAISRGGCESSARSSPTSAPRPAPISRSACASPATSAATRA